MGRHKRSSKDREGRIKRKIKKLQQKLRRTSSVASTTDNEQGCSPEGSDASHRRPNSNDARHRLYKSNSVSDFDEAATSQQKNRYVESPFDSEGSIASFGADASHRSRNTSERVSASHRPNDVITNRSRKNILSGTHFQNSQANSGQGAHTNAEVGVESVFPVSLPSTSKSDGVSDELVIEIEDSILEMLGDKCPSIKAGDKIHDELAHRWSYALLNGLAAPKLNDLFGKHIIPENCGALLAPKVNPELQAILQEPGRVRDNYFVAEQNQLGHAMTALARVIDSVLIKPDLRQEPNLLSTLSEAGKILADLHYRLSITRRGFLKSCVDKSMHVMLDASPIDSFIYGNDLADRWKELKKIENSGNELKVRPKVRPGGPPKGNLNARTPFRSQGKGGGRLPVARKPLQTYDNRRTITTGRRENVRGYHQDSNRKRYNQYRAQPQARY